MHTIAATEASRSFAALLDGAARGESTVITRGGRRIALIGPVATANGAPLLAYLDTVPIDDDFETDVRAARETALPKAPEWPAD